MTEWLAEPAGTAVLAFITTLHCALTLLRNHRSTAKTRVMVLPSIAFSISPWFLTSPLWLATALVAHMAWFAACERFLPLPVAGPPLRPPSMPAPRPKGFQPLPVLATFAETAEIRTFRFERPAGFTFQPGQFVMVRTTAGPNTMVRCYSITSAPEISGSLEISVRNQGIVSRHLHETLRAGMTLEVNGPGGAFVYPPGDRPIVLLAGGIGITPLLSMLRHGVASEPRRAITLILSAKTAAHVPFLDELLVLVHRHPQFRLAITLSGAADPRFFSGRINASLLQRVVPDLSDRVCMICGPLPMIDEVRRILDVLAVPAEQVHFEKFEAATALASATTPRAQVTLRKSKRTLEVAEGQTILEATDAAGISLSSLCRVGVCGTCRTRVISGSVDGDFDALDAAEQAEGWVLACVGRPLTDCLIDV